MGKHAPARLRRSGCPTYGHKCEQCGKEHHLESVCRSKDKAKTTWNARPPKPDHQKSATFDTRHDDSVFNSLYTLTDSISKQHSQKSIAIDHHLYDQLIDTWIRKYSYPQLFIKLTARVLPDDYAAFGFTFDSPARAASLPALFDTGFQSCLAGMKVFHRLGLN